MLRNKTINIIYKRATYVINIKEGIHIVLNEMWLINRRFLRLGKRLLNYSKFIFLILFCLVIFTLGVIPLGLIFHKYTNWYDGIWDLRMFFLTSIVVVYVTTVINNEKKRKNILINQFNIYLELKFIAEGYLGVLCKNIGFTYDEDILLTSIHCDTFLEKMQGYQIETSHECFDDSFDEIPSYITKKDIFIMYSNRLLKVLREYKSYVSLDTIIGFDSYTKERFDSCINKIENEIYITDKINIENFEYELKSYIYSMTYPIFLVLVEMRKPWRWDYERNKKIRNILREKAICIKEYDKTNYWTGEN